MHFIRSMNHNFLRMRHPSEPHHWQKWPLILATRILYCRNHTLSSWKLPMDEGRNWETAYSKSYPQQSVKLVSTIIVIPKGDRGKRLVIDYWALNKVTRKFTWPMPKVEDIFSKLNGAKYFSTLELRAGYHHNPLDKSLIPKTAFNSPFGKFEYVKVPFRLAQAPAYFQDLMTRILKGLWLHNSIFRWHNNIQ